MSMTTAFVTGPTGCIGAATVQYLIDHGVEHVIGMSRKRDLSRIDPEYHDRIKFIEGDITNRDQVSHAIASTNPDTIIHLAAFQTPDCLANPLLGMEVNVTGTRNIVLAAKELGNSLQRLVLASSSAVYGHREMYPGDSIVTDVPYAPRNLYGYWKVANEGMAQAFHAETEIPTVSVRLSTCYGPGRDLGMTSAPTTLLKCVAAEQSFQMPYQGREHFHFVGDVGAGFAEVGISPFSGYGVFNLRGRTIHTTEYIELAKTAAGELGISDPDISIADDAQSMPFANDLDDQESVTAFPNMPLTDMSEGVRYSIMKFREMHLAGILDPEYRPGG